MKKIFTLGILGMLLLTAFPLISAEEQNNVSMKELKINVVKSMGNFVSLKNALMELFIGIFQQERELRTCYAEVDKWKDKYKHKSCSSSTTIIEVVPQDGDMNGDGVVDLIDLGIAGDLIETIKKNYKK